MEEKEKMSEPKEPTKEEMLKCIKQFIFPGTPYNNKTRQVLKAIYCLIENMDKKPEVNEEFIKILRDKVMAIPRKAIADEIKKEFIKNGVWVK